MIITKNVSETYRAGVGKLQRKRQRPLQNFFSSNNRNPKTGFRLFSAVSAPNHSLILPKYPLNPPRIPDNQASGPPFRRQQTHLAC